MLRKVMLWALLAFVVAPTAQAGDAMREALAQLPGDAMAVLCIPSLKQLDADYQQVINDLGLKEMMQPPANSLLALVKGSLPIFAQMDDARPMALVVMPATNMMEMNQKAVLIVPTADPKAVVEGIGAQAGENGVYSGSIMGQPAHFVLGEKRLIVAQSDAVAKALAAKSTGLDAKMKPDELKSFENLDIALWINADSTMKMLKPMIDGFLPMMLMSMSSTPTGAKQAEATKKQVDMLVDGMASLTIGVALGKEGLDLRVGFTSKSGSELAAQTKMKPTAESLLKGLPGEKFMAAFGQVVDAAQTEASMKYIDPYFEMLDTVEGIDKEKSGQLKGLVKEMLPMITGARGLVQVIPAGSAGLLGVTLLIDTKDGAKFLEMKGKAIETVKSLIATATNDHVDDDAKKMVAAITYNASAEEIAGAKVGQFKFDLAQVPDLDDEARAQIEKVVGKDGLMLRSTPVDANIVAITFGGGADYMAKTIQSAKKKEAALDSQPGITKIGAQLPKERASIIYVALDQIVAGIGAIMKETGGEELPFKVPAMQSPIALSSTGGNEWSRMDIVFPSEVLKAGKDVIMAMTGAGAEGDEAAPPGDEKPEKAGE